MIIHFIKVYNFKNVDFWTIIFTSLSYKIISDYLNSKFSIKPLIIKFNGKKIIKDTELLESKKKIKIYFIDFYYYTSEYHKYQIMKIKEILSKKFEIILDSNNPDYLFYNVFGCFHMKKKYNNAIKIAYFTENQLPDFNIADYAIGQAHINLLDRYLRIPYLIGLRSNYFNNTMFNIIRRKFQTYPRKKFCAAVISNHHNSSYFRLNFINELNKYKKVDMGGKYKNNVGFIKNKILFLRNYKFSIAMENSEGDGYISEKIIHSFLSGTIPIYYGNYMIDEIINPNSYILIRNEKDITKKINFIKSIDTDNNLYQKMLKEKVFTNIKFKEIIENKKIDFLMNIFSQDKAKARRTNNYNYHFN